MTKVLVIIDNSGSMFCLSKSDILESICRSIYLHEDIEADYYRWDTSITRIDYQNEELIKDVKGTANLGALVDFIEQQVVGNIILLTDGYIDGDKTDLNRTLKENKEIKMRLVGVGADWNSVVSSQLFPPSFIAENKTWYIFNTLELDAALDSFLEV